MLSVTSWFTILAWKLNNEEWIVISNALIDPYNQYNPLLETLHFFIQYLFIVNSSFIMPSVASLATIAVWKMNNEEWIVISIVLIDNSYDQERNYSLFNILSSKIE